jgi:hypothetical protein
MNNTTNAETSAAKVARRYDVVQFDCVIDTHAEFHACGCAHTKKKKPFSFTYQDEYKGDTLAELKREIELEWNADFANDNGVTPEEYIENYGGMVAGTEEGSELRIMPCVKFGGGK